MNLTEFWRHICDATDKGIHKCHWLLASVITAFYWLIHELAVKLYGKKHFIIAVDASPKMGGGILLDKSAKKFYYYSVDFEERFDFLSGIGPDKFEMINAWIGLEIFRGYVRWGSEVILKTDNKFNEFLYSGSDNECYKVIQQKIRDQVSNHPFYGKIIRESRETVEIRIADLLSHGKSDEALDLCSGYYRSRYEFVEIYGGYASEKVDTVYDEIKKLSKTYPVLNRMLRSSNYCTIMIIVAVVFVVAVVFYRYLFGKED